MTYSRDEILSAMDKQLARKNLIEYADMRTDDVLSLVEALEFECDNRCHPEHNPCNARNALNNFYKKIGLK